MTYNKGSRIFCLEYFVFKIKIFLQYSFFARLKNIEEFVQMTKIFARPPKNVLNLTPFYFFWKKMDILKGRNFQFEFRHCYSNLNNLNQK